MSGGSHLYARSRLLFAHAADQGPSVAGDLGHVGDRLHLLRIPDAHLHSGILTHNVRLGGCSHVGAGDSDSFRDANTSTQRKISAVCAELFRSKTSC